MKKKWFFLLALLLAGCKPAGWMPRPLFQDPASTPPASTSDPTISFDQPTNGQVLAGIFTFVIKATAPSGVKQVTLEVDGVQRGNVEMVAPYEVVWNTAEIPDGPHVLTAKLLDTGGVSTVSAPLTVTIKNTVVPVDRTATFTWTAPLTNADGTPLTDLAGYQLYQSTSAGGPWTATGGLIAGTTTTLNGFADGVYYFALRAVDTAGHESQLSNVVSKSFGA